MPRTYPNIGSEKVCTSGNCSKCKAKITPQNPGSRLDVQVSYFRGEDEVDNYCKACTEVVKAWCRKYAHEESERVHKVQMKKAERRQSDVEKLKVLYPDVKEFTEYQLRVNGVLDIYPTNRLWHDIKGKRRGRYNDVVQFCQNFFATAK